MGRTLRSCTAVLISICLLLGGILTSIRPALADHDKDRYPDNPYWAKTFTVQDSDPSQFNWEGGIASDHAVGKPFPVYVFLADYDWDGLPLTAAREVDATLTLGGPDGYRKTYPVKIEEGQTYAEVDITCPNTGIWSVWVTGQMDSQTVAGGPWFFPIGSPKFVGMSIEPPQATLTSGQSKQFRASLVFFGRWAISVSDYCTWTSDKPSVATVSDSESGNPSSQPTGGLVTAGYTSGTATITAALPPGAVDFLKLIQLILSWFSGAKWLSSYSATATVTVGSPPVLQVTPLVAEVAVKGTVQLKAQLVYPDGTVTDVTKDVQWTTQHPKVATVANATEGEAGRVTGLAPGSSVITAMYPDLPSATATVHVSSPVLTLAPANPLVYVNAGSRFQFKAMYSDGVNLPLDVTQQATWSSSNPADPINLGSLSAFLSGTTATIQAEYNGMQSLPTILTVVQPALKIGVARAGGTIFVAGSGQGTGSVISINAGETVQLKALYSGAFYSGADGTYQNVTNRDVTDSVTWTTGPDASSVVVLQASGPGRILGVGTGQSTVSATYPYPQAEDPYTQGQPLQNSVTLTVVQPTLTVNAPTTTLASGSPPVRFTAVYSDAYNTDEDVTSEAAWSSSDSTVATVDASGNVRAVYSGTADKTANITAAYQPPPSANSPGSQPAPVSGNTVTVNVVNAQTVSGLKIEPLTAALNVGGQLTYQVYWLDSGGSKHLLPNNAVTWSTQSSNVTINADGVATAMSVSAQPAIIKAAFGGRTATAALSVLEQGVVWEAEPPPTGS
ncbi:Invasin/intimin cell-adhesion fragments [Acididesulfobacillus acetoxydans]|uniref:Invasin/intimin cell-adhesion n=1 Tax=Acididesulfobacillus acetoxydans TaxID=1561005 RepID=A0A8S0W872_9FIRM|nr:Ig-like domain-containing protein [Acididesulfobacillus acetoxydans]CAA7601569.1 Invasin/intimin cell-adhesion fragments [Acididesulfobacillus acetoxydans]CEJ07056.1 Invasin/intimin cell-adhesion [Acididesulfobacillus acetoxydans]